MEDAPLKELRFESGIEPSSSSAYYAAFAAKDARFDGRFFVGVSSTGIYCRPVCRARLPKESNCAFFPSAAHAEQAGYRPCLLCRPELAPGVSTTDARGTLARRASALIDERCSDGLGLAAVANRLGYTPRHLRRVFTEELGVTPIQYLQTCRLLLAKNMLTDSDLLVADVAMAAGFGSLRRFNGAFRQHYQLSPTELRKATAAVGTHDPGVTVTLGYRPPLLWDDLLNFLAARAIGGVEVVRDDTYSRTAVIKAGDGRLISGWVTASDQPRQHSISVTLSLSLLPVISQVLTRLRRLFDLDSEPQVIALALQSMAEIRPGGFVPGTRVPGCFEPFELVTRAVLGQQITVKAASTLATRIVQRFGQPIDTGIEGLTHTFPTAEQVLGLDDEIEDQFGALGVLAARSRTIVALARALCDGEIDLAHPRDPTEEIKKLLTIKGIGGWTAHYIAMRAMAWPDAFLETDAGIKKALAPRTVKESVQLAQAWRPWRSYATFALWNSL